jgi:hypothetical protein
MKSLAAGRSFGLKPRFSYSALQGVAPAEWR